ncbi:O-antigen ligase family protein [Dokdonella immobilis]|uniref:O-antigen ligase n=1 Tax=Dokdonella immobilis TaxID=578942 RepID=A0A1I4Y1J6_9GAMM|nr:O-antigen ligase family protein [Dokdonella immobilis]SFN31944.1 O-antigen ligase [Dokdonella immobilis]
MVADGGAVRGERALAMSGALLLLVCFCSGGNSAQGNWGTTISGLLAVPLLVVAAHRSGAFARRGLVRWGALVAAAIGLLPLLQLLPIPDWLWNLPLARRPLLQDLEAAGIVAPDRRWSLTPGATERDLWFLLPGLALFFCALAVRRSAWRPMLWLVVGLALANLLFAAAQFAAGKDSILNPYPDFAPAWGGIFANTNHQADLLVIGLMLALMFLAHAWRRSRETGHFGVAFVVPATLALMFVAALPVVGSRAGVIVAMIMLMGVTLGSGLARLRAIRESRTLQIGALLSVVVFVIGLQAAVGWLRIDAGDPTVKYPRSRMLIETLRVGAEHAPLGAGVGGFMPAYQQGARNEGLMNVYVNNAHNDYAQWWLEAGIAGIAITLLALGVLVSTLIRLLRLPPGSGTRSSGLAAMMGIGVIVLHSMVDYPLRTQALMAIFAVLAGIAVAAASAEPVSPRRRGRRRLGASPAE